MSVDLGELLAKSGKRPAGDVSDSDTSGREQIQYIDIGRIEDDPRNFYSLSGLEELAANIELLGLQQPLRVRADPEDGSSFIVVSGHRRKAALHKLVQSGRGDLAMIPCIVERWEGSEALQELRLIYANRDTRTMTSAELSRQAERVELLLYQLKEEGYDFPGRMRDHVAQACKVSAPKLARLKVIREKLIPAYLEKFDRNKLPEQTAYTLARFPEEFQERLYKTVANEVSGATLERVLEKYNGGWRWEPSLACPDGKVCRHGDAFLRHDCNPGWGSLCGGETCCLDCPEAKTDYSPCARMCSRAQARRKEEKDEKEKAAHERRQKEGRKYQKATQRNAKRLLPVIDASGIVDDELIHWDFNGTAVRTIRRWAAGEFDDPADWHYDRLVPGKLYDLKEAATKLKCSTDFLMGFTEDPRPPAAEEPGEAGGNVSESDTREPENRENVWRNPNLDFPAKKVQWQMRAVPMPETGTFLTWKLTNVGSDYCILEFPRDRKNVKGERYTRWLEIPPPGSDRVFELEQEAGQLVLNGWNCGGTLPMDAGDVVADFDCDGKTVRKACYFDGAEFRFNRGGAKIDLEPVRWMRLPPVEGIEGTEEDEQQGASDRTERRL